MAVVKQEVGAGLYGRRSPIESWVRGGSARDGLRYSEVDTEERLALWQECLLVCPHLEILSLGLVQ